jgi:hypothetical protein
VDFYNDYMGSIVLRGREGDMGEQQRDIFQVRSVKRTVWSGNHTEYGKKAASTKGQPDFITMNDWTLRRGCLIKSVDDLPARNVDQA